MAKERLYTRKIKEVLRLRFEHQQSAGQIAKSCGIARSTVKEYLHWAQQAALPWPLPAEMDDAALENWLFPPVTLISAEKRQMPPMDLNWGADILKIFFTVTPNPLHPSITPP
jgi:hypothetical protein